jgi:hypothetical protein
MVENIDLVGGDGRREDFQRPINLDRPGETDEMQNGEEDNNQVRANFDRPPCQGLHRRLLEARDLDFTNTLFSRKPLRYPL